MPDQLPNSIGDAGHEIEATPVVLIDKNGDSIAVASASKDEVNSVVTAVAADGDIPGEWVTNNDPQIAFNAGADQIGVLYIELSPDGGETITFSKGYTVGPGDSRFDALVKMPGRSHRVRFVNESGVEANVAILVATGTGLYPYRIGKRDRPKFASISGSASSGTPLTYKVLVDLDDTTNFPHRDTGHIELVSVFFRSPRLPTLPGRCGSASSAGSTAQMQT